MLEVQLLSRIRRVDRYIANLQQQPCENLRSDGNGIATITSHANLKMQPCKGIKYKLHACDLQYVNLSNKRIILLLLLMLALQPTMGFSLLGDFLPFRPFLTQFSPPSYSHHLDILLNVFNPSFPWSSSDSPTHWLPF